MGLKDKMGSIFTPKVTAPETMPAPVAAKRELPQPMQPTDTQVRVARNMSDKPSKLAVHERAALYIAENPHVYSEFCKTARMAMEMGHKVISGSMIREQIRWNNPVRGSGEYKISNDAAAYMMRKFAKDFPHLPKDVKINMRKTKQEMGME